MAHALQMSIRMLVMHVYTQKYGCFVELLMQVTVDETLSTSTRHSALSAFGTLLAMSRGMTVAYSKKFLLPMFNDEPRESVRC